MELASGGQIANGALAALLIVFFGLTAATSPHSDEVTGASVPISAACTYPHFSDRRACGIHDKSLLSGWICDPDSTVSMSEVYVIDDTLRRVYTQHADNCQCPSYKKKPCWYKFAFAFLRELDTPSQSETLFGVQSGTYCPNDTVPLTRRDASRPHRNSAERTYDSFTAYALTAVFLWILYFL